MTNYSSSLATRGVIFANIQRSNSSTGSVSGGWRPLHKPQWFEAFREVYISPLCFLVEQPQHVAFAGW